MATKIRLANLQTQRWLAHSIFEYPTNEQSKSEVNLIANIIQIMDERGISFKSSGNTYGVPEFLRPHTYLIETVITPDITYTKLRLKKEIEISTDRLLVKAGSENAKRAATFVIHKIEANFGIVVNETLSLTKTEAKAVLLALKAVPYKCKLTLNTDSQANVIKAVIGEKKIDLNINKVAAHTDVSENEMADKLAKEAITFDTVKWAYNAKNISYIPSCRGIELDLNIRHFLSQQIGIQKALNWIGNDKV
ncbi:hypothetical protein G9A89_016019 [Geosiphon pyriformis]|nr:hypothetical protein G9A89_016019 [Geosiphon pyriformis]